MWTSLGLNQGPPDYESFGIVLPFVEIYNFFCVYFVDYQIICNFATDKKENDWICEFMRIFVQFLFSLFSFCSKFYNSYK